VVVIGLGQTFAALLGCGWGLFIFARLLHKQVAQWSRQSHCPQHWQRMNETGNLISKGSSEFSAY
jgi:hypothetical protein